MTADLDDLAAFAAVARAGGFREAARGTNGSASGLSEAVRRLEVRVGVRLFNRTTRSMVLTEAGVLLLDRVDPALLEVIEALDAVGQPSRKSAGALRLSVPFGATRTLLMDLVPESWRPIRTYVSS